MSRTVNNAMDSQDPRDQISLYLYGELDVEQQARFEAELEGSSDLAAAVENERRFLEDLNQRSTIDVPETLIGECRHELMRAVYREERAIGAGYAASPWAWLRGIFSGPGGFRAAWQPALAVTLIAVGFFGGHATRTLFEAPTLGAGTGTEIAVTDGAGGTPISGASLVSLGSEFPDVRSIEMGPGGSQVRIVVEERRTITGLPSDPRIQSLLIAMTRSTNSGVRLDSLDILEQGSADSAIRAALIKAMIEDDNPGVRLKALEALRPYQQDPEVRLGLMAALRGDDNPGMRVQAIEILNQNPDRELIGLLQNVVLEDPNNYVRQQCEQTLEALNASVGLY